MQNNLKIIGNGSTCASWDPKMGLTSCKIMMMYQKKLTKRRRQGAIGNYSMLGINVERGNGG